MVKRIRDKPKLIIIFISFIVYFPSIWGDWLWDDYHHIVYNTRLYQFSLKITEPFMYGYWQKTTIQSRSGYYRPLSLFIDFLNAKITGINKKGFHLVNILLHLITVWFIYCLFKLIIDEKKAFWAALLFAIHPSWSESVLFVSARVDILTTLFAIISLYYFFKQDYGRTLLFFIISVLTKENGVMLFPFFLLYEIFIRRLNRRSLLFILVIILFLLFRIVIFPRFVKGLLNPEYSLTPFIFTWKWFKIIFYQIGTYFRLFFFPYPLSLMWGQDPSYVTLGFIFFAILVLLVIYTSYLYFSKRDESIIFVLGFIFSILPGCLIFYLPYIIAEHHLYFAAVFLITLVFRKLKLDKKTQYILLVIYVILAVVTVNRAIMVRDSKNVYLDSIRYHPRSDAAYSLLATYYLDKNQFDIAYKYLKKSLELDPYDLSSYVNLSNYYIIKREYNKAFDVLIKAEKLKLRLKFPKYFLNLYIVSKMLGKEDIAQKSLARFKKMLGRIYRPYVIGTFRQSLKDCLHYVEKGQASYAFALLDYLEYLPLSEESRIYIELYRIKLFIKKGDKATAKKLFQEMKPHLEQIKDKFELYNLYIEVKDALESE